MKADSVMDREDAEEAFDKTKGISPEDRKAMGILLDNELENPQNEHGLDLLLKVRTRDYLF